MKLKVIGVLLVLISIIVISCQSDDELEFKRYYTNGKVVYQKKCENCHGKNGEGLSNLIPPLTDSAYLKNNKNQLACFVINGMKSKLIIVAHKSFVGDMPPTEIAPIEVAEVLTYLNNSFGNKLGITNVEHVNADLQHCK